MAGIYIHIPFCRQACTYCNFHFSTSLTQKLPLLEAIGKEIGLTENSAPGDEIDSLYFGGGTPSLLNGDELKKIFNALEKKFTISKNAEITLEANPDDIDPLVLEQWMKNGINRISLGVQSFKEEELRWMNRAHNAAQSLKSIDEILSAGITNFSVDLIFGSPLSGTGDLKNNLEIIFEKNAPHVSCYALTVEPRTALHKMIGQKRSLGVDEAKQAEQFLLLMDLMGSQGYEHYEISNFAKPGMRSKHNSSYWQGKVYYGFGPSAHSFDGNNTRRWNISNNASYIQSIEKNILPSEAEELTATQQLNEYIMTSLRTMEGTSLEFIRSKYGRSFSKKLLEESNQYIATKKLFLEKENLVLTKEGKLFADGIAAGLFF